MTFDEFQKACERTVPTTQGRDSRLANFAMGLCGEAGETGELVKKHLFHGKNLDAAKVEKELGDVLWYAATLATTCGLTLEQIAIANQAKLRARYPDGFSPAASEARVDTAPKCVLCGTPRVWTRTIAHQDYVRDIYAPCRPCADAKFGKRRKAGAA